MKLFRSATILAGIGLALLSAPAALAWETGFERGLNYYTASTGGILLTLVCDPDSVFGATSTSGLLIERGAVQDYSGPVTLTFPDETAISTNAEHGRIGKEFTPPETWETLLESLRSNTELNIEIDGAAQKVVLGEPAEFTCN